jgi:NADPH:quinone reductase-like Zn-dependent oxidoreductase
MAIGTAGLTAMLAILALEAHGLTPGQGPVLVTGAAGGVGSVAVALLAAMGHEVAAVTGRPETEGYLRDLGAARIVPRADLAETVKRPLEAETWAGCVDAVGGAMLARVLGQMKYGASLAAVGLAGGALIGVAMGKGCSVKRADHGSACGPQSDHGAVAGTGRLAVERLAKPQAGSMGGAPTRPALRRVWQARQTNGCHHRVVEPDRAGTVIGAKGDVHKAGVRGLHRSCAGS